jgi:hypothetical protein
VPKAIITAPDGILLPATTVPLVIAPDVTDVIFKVVFVDMLATPTKVLVIIAFKAPAPPTPPWVLVPVPPTAEAPPPPPEP